VLLKRFVMASVLAIAACRPAAQSSPLVAKTPEEAMYPALTRNLHDLSAGIDAVPAERRAALDRIAVLARARRAAGDPVRLVFICTGNSRRSHLGQLWAAAAARYHALEGIETYSGGTEPSAFNPRTIAAVERAGFVVEPTGDDGDNPHYRVRWSDDGDPIDAFSKRYDDPANPKADFVAVMTCSEADQACPLVPGATLRVSLPYEDPKVADGTPEEAARYDERSRQIATEMLYLFSRVAER
jgi:arsenate reductase (thioredoxin)